MDNVQEKNERHSQRPATAERHQDLTRRLLEAAEAVIGAAGLGKLRARSLADAAGCSVGAIYGVFPDLDALVLAVNVRTLDAIDEAMGATAAGRSPGLHLRRLADAYLDYAFLNRRCQAGTRSGGPPHSTRSRHRSPCCGRTCRMRNASC